MIFLTYDFVAYALIFFCAYGLIREARARLALILAASLIFQIYYGGLASLLPALALAILCWGAALSGNQTVMAGAIAVCVVTLIFYKYSVFLTASLLESIWTGATGTVQSVVPALIPLGISFFVFEFIHYLTDIRRGGTPIRSATDFAAFALFWPTMVAGPIKRYQQFIPALHEGVKNGGSSQDFAHGLLRITVGCSKKFLADNLTGWIDFIEPQLAHQSPHMRWLFLGAVALRILFDFSGYSDMAIGYARMMGIRVPENFNWPYLAHNLGEFWLRWHMSLSLWIRDYVYIPLGGNRLGLPRAVINALCAMVVCGLWHGAAWHFAAWGLWHGFGLVMNAALQAGLNRLHIADHRLVKMIGWPVTLLFVSLGWLIFFYPVTRAAEIALLLVSS